MARKRVSKKINNVVRGYARRLATQEKIPIKKVIVFGSRSKGISHRWSDIDVCIISPKLGASLKTLQFLLKKRNREEVMAGLEPMGFSEKDFKAGSSLINEIKRTGVGLKI